MKILVFNNQQKHLRKSKNTIKITKIYNLSFLDIKKNRKKNYLII